MSVDLWSWLEQKLVASESFQLSWVQKSLQEAWSKGNMSSKPKDFTFISNFLLKLSFKIDKTHSMKLRTVKLPLSKLCQPRKWKQMHAKLLQLHHTSFTFDCSRINKCSGDKTFSSHQHPLALLSHTIYPPFDHRSASESQKTINRSKTQINLTEFCRQKADSFVTFSNYGN